jgi:hypothetical protein
MSAGSPFLPDFAVLPDSLPIFPLTGVLLLPRGRLPLNIFEPRYLAMTNDALAGARLIGMVQPVDGSGQTGLTPGGPADRPPIYPVGCAGRITAFNETEDGRILLSLTGLIRFRVAEELEGRNGYRRVRPDWTPFRADLAADELSIDRAPLLGALEGFLRRRSMEADMQGLQEISDEALVTTLAMGCPFAPNEKQLLLECTGAAERAELLATLFRMTEHGEGSTAHSH